MGRRVARSQRIVGAAILLSVALSGCSLWGWGNNLSGQIGDGTSATRLSPSPAPPIFDNWAQLSAGELHNCGIRVGNTLWCWGENSAGQLGNGFANDQALPVVVGSATWSSFDPGGTHTCGVRTDQSLWCWGLNGSGQLGDGTTTVDSTPSPSGSGRWKIGDRLEHRRHHLGWSHLRDQGGRQASGAGATTTRRSARRRHPTVADSARCRSAARHGARCRQADAHTCGIRSDQTLWVLGLQRDRTPRRRDGRPRDLAR